MSTVTSAELDAVRDAVVKLLAPYADPAAPSDPAMAWRELLDFGVGQDPHGDAGLGALGLAVVAKEAGAVVAAVPVASGAALSALHTTALRPVAAAIAGSGRQLAVVTGHTSVRVEPTADAWRVAGRVTGVLGGPEAREIVLLGQAAGGPVLLVAELAAAGVSREAQLSHDPRRGLERVTFDDVVVAAERVAATEAIDVVAQWGSVTLCADAVGAAHRLSRLAVEYAGQREQFGQAIGSFQAVQHLLAETHVLAESMWSLVLAAAAALDDPAVTAGERQRAVSVAKAYVSREAREVAQASMQVFGGIAFTTEHVAHHHLRRILDAAQAFGDAAHHEAELGRALIRGAAARAGEGA